MRRQLLLRPVDTVSQELHSIEALGVSVGFAPCWDPSLGIREALAHSPVHSHNSSLRDPLPTVSTVGPYSPLPQELMDYLSN